MCAGIMGNDKGIKPLSMHSTSYTLFFPSVADIPRDCISRINFLYGRDWLSLLSFENG